MNTPRSFLAALAVVLLSAHAVEGSALTNKPESPTDLMVMGRVQGLKTKSAYYLSYAALAHLPKQKVHVTGEFVPGDQEVTAVFVSDVWKELPIEEDADVLLATCSDGYVSVYTKEYVMKNQPFFVVEINGLDPKKWPPPGLTFNPGPYIITVSDQFSPGVSKTLDVEHKKPWGVTKIEFARYQDRFRDSYAGRWGAISTRAEKGREIWINSCACCHEGPGKTFAGTKSKQSFEILTTVARFNPDLFSRYVRDPVAVLDAAEMQPHPHYSDEQLAQLIAFILAEPKAAL